MYHVVLFYVLKAKHVNVTVLPYANNDKVATCNLHGCSNYTRPVHGYFE